MINAILKFINRSNANPQKRTRGLIEFHELTAWYDDLTNEERALLRKYHSDGMGFCQDDLDTGHVQSSKSRLYFLNGCARAAFLHKDYGFSERILNYALLEKSKSYMDRHFTYLTAIELTYTLAHMGIDAERHKTMCKMFCEKDIEIRDKTLADMKAEDDRYESKRKSQTEKLPPLIVRYPAFDYLAALYAENNDLTSCMDTIKKALERGELKFSFERSPYKAFRLLKDQLLSCECDAEKQHLIRELDFLDSLEVLDKAQTKRLLGELHEKHGENALAIRCFEEAISLNPNIGVKRRLKKLQKLSVQE